MNTRLSYIDVAKGLLILMVVFLHVGYYPTSVWGGVNRAFELGMNAISYLFIPFFMAAFFILSGFCSDAGKKRSVEETIKKGIIRLLVPMILLKFDHDQWFCWAMFFALIFDCLIELIKNKFWRMIVLAVLPVVATFCNSRGWDYTYLDYAMVFTPFLYIGRHFKQIVSNNKVGVVCTIVYCICILGWFFLYKGPAPRISGNAYHTTVWQLPVFFILSISGTSALMLVSRWIAKNKVLEYIGRNSLVYFLFHFNVLYIAKPFIGKLTELDGNYAVSALLYLLLFALVLAICTVVSKLLNHYLPWLVNKQRWVL